MRRDDAPDFRGRRCCYRLSSLALHDTRHALRYGTPCGRVLFGGARPLCERRCLASIKVVHADEAPFDVPNFGHTHFLSQSWNSRRRFGTLLQPIRGNGEMRPWGGTEGRDWG